MQTRRQPLIIKLNAYQIVCQTAATIVAIKARQMISDSTSLGGQVHSCMPNRVYAPSDDIELRGGLIDGLDSYKYN